LSPDRGEVKITERKYSCIIVLTPTGRTLLGNASSNLAELTTPCFSKSSPVLVTVQVLKRSF